MMSKDPVSGPLHGLVLLGVAAALASAAAASGQEDRSSAPAPASASAPADPEIQEHLDARFRVLRSFMEDLEAGAIEDFRGRAAELDQAVEFLVTWERSRSSLARGMQARTNDPEVLEAVEAFHDAAHAARERRLELPMQELAHVGGDMPAERFAEGISAFIEAHRAAREAGRELHRLRTRFDLPTSAVVYGPDEVEARDGGEFSVEYLVENLANHELRDVHLGLEALPGGQEVPITVTPRQVDGVPPGGTETVTVRGTVPDGGDPLLAQLTLEGPDVRESVMLTVREGR